MAKLTLNSIKQLLGRKKTQSEQKVIGFKTHHPALNVPEIVEKICLNLDFISILTAKCVSKNFDAIISGSVLLRQAVGLEGMFDGVEYPFLSQNFLPSHIDYRVFVGQTTWGHQIIWHFEQPSQIFRWGSIPLIFKQIPWIIEEHGQYRIKMACVCCPKVLEGQAGVIIHSQFAHRRVTQMSLYDFIKYVYDEESLLWSNKKPGRYIRKYIVWRGSKTHTWRHRLHRNGLGGEPTMVVNMLWQTPF